MSPDEILGLSLVGLGLGRIARPGVVVALLLRWLLLVAVMYVSLTLTSSPR